MEDTVAATRKMLASDGWKEYFAPLEKRGGTLLAFKKGGQGLSVSFTMTGGKAINRAFIIRRRAFVLRSRFPQMRATSCSTTTGRI